MTTIALPRLLVAAPASGHGKTTISTGLIAALRARGLAVSPHKVGPDYIDPGYHALAAGRPGRNLDAFLAGEERIVPLLRHGASTPEHADIAVIEGVMGLFDGARSGRDPDFASPAHIARLTGSPVVLVVDVTGMGRSIAALLHGYATFDPRVRLVGVIFNKVGSAGHADLLRAAVLPTGIEVLGAIPRRATLAVPARHLGLVPATDAVDAARALLAELADVVTRNVDLEAVVRLAATAPPLPDGAGLPGGGPLGSREPSGDEGPSAGTNPAPAAGASAGAASTAARGARRDITSAGMPAAAAATMPSGPAVRIAMAAGPAFVAGYTENRELLTAAGAEVVPFDPIADGRLPAGTAGLIVSCGSIEVHAEALAANPSLRAEIAALAAAGAPVIGECAGLAYLSRSFGDAEAAVPMCGVFDIDALLGTERHLGYRVATALTDSVLGPAGMRVHGHEFHRTAVRLPQPPASAWTWQEQGKEVMDGWIGGPSRNAHGSFLHLHWAGTPEIPDRIVTAARRFRDTRARR